MKSSTKNTSSAIIYTFTNPFPEISAYSNMLTITVYKIQDNTVLNRMQVSKMMTVFSSLSKLTIKYATLLTKYILAVYVLLMRELENVTRNRTHLFSPLHLYVKIFVPGLGLFQNRAERLGFEVLDEQPHYPHPSAQLFRMKQR